MQGQMQAYPLTLDHVFRRAERLFGDKGVATAAAGGPERTTYGEWAQRTRRLGGVLDDLGISADGRVGTFAWNSARHLELYFAAPCSGRVLHTLNIRLFPDQLAYVVDHAEDEVIFADRSLMGLLWPLVDGFDSVRHIVVMDDGAGDVPDDPRILDYEELLAAADPVEFHVQDEDRAAAMCYTSGTTGNPKGVVYSHRSTVLHSMGTMLVDTLGVSEDDVILPVVPMFHANAWGLAQAARDGGGVARAPGPRPVPGRDRDADGGGEGHAGGRGADDLDGRARRARRPRPVGAAGHRVRRLGRPALAVGGLPGEARAADPAGLGDDRDEPARLRVPRAQHAPRRLRGPARRAARAPGHRRAAGRHPHRGARDRRGAAVGRRGAAASCSAPARGSRPATTAASARRSSPTTAGCAPATSR